MSAADNVKNKLQGLISKANAATGNADADLTAAMNSLIEGYGSAPVESSPKVAVRTITLTTALGNGVNSNYTALSGDEFVMENYDKDNFCVLIVPVEPFAGASGYNVHGIFHGNRNIGSLMSTRYGVAYCSTAASSLSVQHISARLTGYGTNVSLRARETGNLSIYISSSRRLNAGTYLIIMSCAE
ncbi:MAG: hypothetical protein IJC56_02425 [Clostridia bacterium]|nr:hypothetical protein [Clostridia bacterium]